MSCGGKCCERFVIPFSPEDLREMYQGWLVSGTHSSPVMSKRHQDSHSNYRDTRRDPEIYLLYPMLKYLGFKYTEPCNPRKKLKNGSHQYTCKHYDKKTKLCTIYEIRPRMCRDYPNGHACLFPGCKLKGNDKLLKSEQKRHTENDYVKQYDVEVVEETTRRRRK